MADPSGFINGLTAQTAINQYPSVYEQLDATQNLSFDNDSFLVIEKKLSQLSLQNNNGSDRNCDLNGNDSSTSLLSSSSTRLPISNHKFLENQDVYFDDSVYVLNNSPISSLNSWTVESVLNNLRSKLGTIKHAQKESQNNLYDMQNNFSLFSSCCRNQLNIILQEFITEIEQTFKNRMLELSFQKDQIENILQKIEEKKQLNSSENLRSHEEDIFINLFESDVVNVAKNVLEQDNVLSAVFSEFQTPNVDVMAIDRAFRSFLIPLMKQHHSLIKINSHTAIPTAALNPSYTFQNVLSTKSDNLDGNFIVPNNFAVMNSVQAWQATNTAKSSNMLSSNSVPSDLFLSNNTDNTNIDFCCNINSYDNMNAYYEQLNVPNENHQIQHLDGNDLTILNQKQAITKSLQPKIRRDRITYYLKFGEQGAMEGQFAEPSGVAVNANNDEIYIADANNHRVQVFDKWGKFKFHFGDGKLKFPNRVALSRNTGDIIVSERPPVHQIQVYSKNGSFVCKFGAKHLRHPRGIAVDHRNRVVVVECKVMRVFIFNLQGVLLHSFDCSEQIQFPNAVAVSKREEIYISDNRNHCVKVFSFAGEFLRKIGGPGITNYPIGVCLNEASGQLLVVDNYNNLNVTIFRLDGQLLGAYESSAKHQQCLDVALFGEQSIVVTSKDLQVYIYKLKDHSSPVNTQMGNTQHPNIHRRFQQFSNSNSNNQQQSLLYPFHKAYTNNGNSNPRENYHFRDN